MAKAKTTAKKKTTKKVDTPAMEVLDTDVQDDVAFEGVGVIKSEDEVRYTIRLDNKKVEGRTLPQSLAIISGVAGAVKKIILEEED